MIHLHHKQLPVTVYRSPLIIHNILPLTIHTPFIRFTIHGNHSPFTINSLTICRSSCTLEFTVYPILFASHCLPFTVHNHSLPVALLFKCSPFYSFPVTISWSHLPFTVYHCSSFTFFCNHPSLSAVSFLRLHKPYQAKNLPVAVYHGLYTFYCLPSAFAIPQYGSHPKWFQTDIAKIFERYIFKF